MRMWRRSPDAFTFRLSFACLSFAVRSFVRWRSSSLLRAVTFFPGHPIWGSNTLGFGVIHAG